MEPKIPAQKPSKILVAAIAASLAVHLALFVAIQMQPRRETVFGYDHLSSAVWEVFGPTQVVKIVEVYWPGLSVGERPSCEDVEQALGSLDLRRPTDGWCAAGTLESRGSGESWTFTAVTD